MLVSLAMKFSQCSLGRGPRHACDEDGLGLGRRSLTFHLLGARFYPGLKKPSAQRGIKHDGPMDHGQIGSILLLLV